MLYTINYGLGIAYLYTPSGDWESRFNKLAGQCFGIRKSITQTVLIETKEEKPKDLLVGEYERLEHSGDVIVWDKDANKIKSEYDF